MLYVLCLALHLPALHAVDLDAAATSELLELRRMNGPHTPPPVALLVRTGTPASATSNLRQALSKAGGAFMEDTHVVEADRLKQSDLWAFFGAAAGFVGSDSGKLQQILNAKPEGYLLFLGSSSRDVLDRSLDLARIGKVPGARLRNHALLLEVQDTDLIAGAMTVAQMHLHADRSTAFDGYRLDMFSGFRFRAWLECAAALTP